MPKFKVTITSRVYYWHEVEAENEDYAAEEALSFSQVFTSVDGVDYEDRMLDYEIECLDEEENDDADV